MQSDDTRAARGKTAGLILTAEPGSFRNFLESSVSGYSESVSAIETISPGIWAERRIGRRGSGAAA